MTKERAQEHLDEIMDWFDFERVYKTMQSLNWTWRFNEQSPTIQEIKRNVKEKFWDIYDRDGGMSVGGGFKVTIAFEEDYVECEFVLTSWDTAHLIEG